MHLIIKESIVNALTQVVENLTLETLAISSPDATSEDLNHVLIQQGLDDE